MGCFTSQPVVTPPSKPVTSQQNSFSPNASRQQKSPTPTITYTNVSSRANTAIEVGSSISTHSTISTPINTTSEENNGPLRTRKSSHNLTTLGDDDANQRSRTSSRTWMSTDNLVGMLNDHESNQKAILRSRKSSDNLAAMAAEAERQRTLTTLANVDIIARNRASLADNDIKVLIRDIKKIASVEDLSSMVPPAMVTKISNRFNRINEIAGEANTLDDAVVDDYVATVDLLTKNNPTLADIVSKPILNTRGLLEERRMSISSHGPINSMVSEIEEIVVETNVNSSINDEVVTPVEGETTTAIDNSEIDSSTITATNIPYSESMVEYAVPSVNTSSNEIQDTPSIPIMSISNSDAIVYTIPTINSEFNDPNKMLVEPSILTTNIPNTVPMMEYNLPVFKNQNNDVLYNNTSTILSTDVKTSNIEITTSTASNIEATTTYQEIRSF